MKSCRTSHLLQWCNCITNMIVCWKRCMHMLHVSPFTSKPEHQMPKHPEAAERGITIFQDTVEHLSPFTAQSLPSPWWNSSLTESLLWGCRTNMGILLQEIPTGTFAAGAGATCQPLMAGEGIVACLKFAAQTQQTKFQRVYHGARKMMSFSK